MSEWYIIPKENDLMHYGTKGMKWRNRKGPTVKAKTAKSGAKEEGYGVVLNKETVSPAKKKEMERVFRSYAKNYLGALKAGKRGTADAYADLMYKYYNRLNNAEKKQLNAIAKKIGVKPFKQYA